MIGRTLAHYRLLQQIGAGGMGVVYRARDERLERDVALKVLPAGLLPDEGARKRFRKEALALSQLNHPNIATVHDFNTQEGVDFLVMEYIPGVTLAEKISAGPLAEREILRLGIQLAHGLAAAHAAGVVHHDLKPSNMRVTPDGRLKILDFGLAKLFGPASDLVATESRAALDTPGGTLPYMAPEQVRGEVTDARTDIYAAGALLYEMAAGRRPFPQPQGSLLVAAILEQTPPPPHAVARQVSPGLENIILKAMDKDPERRYQSAVELAVDLERLSSPGPIFVGLPRRAARRMRWVRRALITAMAAVLVLGAVSLPPVRRALLSWLSPRPIPAQKNLVVLPFRAIGGKVEDQAYCDGLAETLTAKLAQLAAAHSLQVVPTSEARARRVSDAEQARREFSANLVLDGTVHRAGDELRINCSLVDANTLRQLRAETITAAVAEPFAAQDRLVGAVARMLELELQPRERQALAGHGTQIAGVHEFYLQGRGYLQYHDKVENIDSAMTVFERALKLDAGYAPAYAGLGESYWKKYEQTKDRKWVEGARENCQRALTLDPNLAAAHSCLAMVYNGQGRYENAAGESQRALEQEPANDDAYRELAFALEHQGKLEEAEQTYRRAIELRPHYWAGYSQLGRFFYNRRRYQEAAEQFEQAVALTPDNVVAYYSLGATYAHVERWDQAIAAFKKAIDLRPNYQSYSNLGTAYIRLRRFEEAIPHLERALQLGKQDYRVWGNLARACYWAPGKRERARAMFDQAVRLGRERLQINPQDADAKILLAQYCAMLGHKTEAFRYLKGAFDPPPEDPEFMAIAAVVHNQFGEPAAALQWLEKAFAKGLAPGQIRTFIELDNLRDNRRFQVLLRPRP